MTDIHLDTVRNARRTSAYERIVRSAYLCFDRAGIDRTRIEDIAREAGVSRQTVYSYFKSKIDIVDLISAEESRKVNAEVRRRLVRGQGFDETVTEALLLIVRIAIDNPYIRRIVANREFEAEVASPSSHMHEMHRDWWGRFLAQARASGDIAADLDDDEIILWLTLTQHMLLTRLDGGPVSDEDLRRLIRRFIVEPMLAQRRAS